MKLQVQKRFEERGSALIVTLFIACILGIGLGSCLIMVRAEHDAAVRSQAWTAALIVAEGGVEEALARLNPGAGTVSQADGVHGPLSRSLLGGSYEVTYTTVNAAATIYATGHVAVPSLSTVVSRVVQVAATNAPLFTTALAAKGPIDLNGARLSTDSYDSADPNLSNNGQYPGYGASNTGTNGDVGAVAGVLNASFVRIHGDLFLGPSALVGATNLGPVSGAVRHDFNVDFPDVFLPSTVNWPPAWPVTDYVTDGVTYDNAFLQSGTYTLPGLSGSIYVGAGANVTLRISGDAAVDQIRIAGIGDNAGKMTIYMTGASFSANGDMTVESGLVGSFTYFGLPGNTSISLNGTPDFVGTIYAPGADLELVNVGEPWSWGYDTFNCTGSIVARSMNVFGYYRAGFHYDENLGRARAPRRGYLATAWHALQ